GDDALKQLGRDGEGGGALARVEDAETSAGAGSNVEEAAALPEALRDRVHGAGDLRQHRRNGGSDLRVLMVDDAEHLERGQFADVLRGWVARFRGKSCEVHPASIMGDKAGAGQCKSSPGGNAICWDVSDRGRRRAFCGARHTKERPEACDGSRLAEKSRSATLDVELAARNPNDSEQSGS